MQESSAGVQSRSSRSVPTRILSYFARACDLPSYNFIANRLGHTRAKTNHWYDFVRDVAIERRTIDLRPLVRRQVLINFAVAKLRQLSPENHRAFERDLDVIPAVSDFFITRGDWDYLIKINTRTDLMYQDVMEFIRLHPLVLKAAHHLLAERAVSTPHHELDGYFQDQPTKDLVKFPVDHQHASEKKS